ncbi:unnamed protein product [Echinostoma caproni]|uniref:Neur_chan_LBD domain-containing protein n=1 Tax=Echinostoma caproni TaxID=27848 RepID=A0A183BEU0_9TREM|nr:unnamed protein product [Echinostoma caproni]
MWAELLLGINFACSHSTVNAHSSDHVKRGNTGVEMSYLSNNLLSVVLMDEGLLMSDSKIAWTTIPLPQSLHGGESLDTWFQLSGKQGQDCEGSIHLTMKIRVGFIFLLSVAYSFRTNLDVSAVLCSMTRSDTRIIMV